MVWQTSNIMEERLKFIAKLLDGDRMSSACREFGITRKTGYKIYNRYKECGIQGLSDRSKRPHRYANQIPYQMERAILAIKKEYPNWGAPKIKEKLSKMFPDVVIPAISTVHAALHRNGLVKSKRRARYKAQGTILSTPTKPNDLWCCDYKGEFMLGNKKYCYPLTITDSHSRYLLTCEAQEAIRIKGAFDIFEATFKEYGIPKAIRSDNGIPFSSSNAIYGLSRLSVWWLRLGIDIERIKPGNPQQNGRHERMHRTLKQETTKPAAYNILQQQEKFDRFQEIYNFERPHQGIANMYPGQIYTPSRKEYRGLEDIDYPFADKIVQVSKCGKIFMKNKAINISSVFGGQNVGLTETDDKIWLVTFMKYDLGYFDEQDCNLQKIDNPFNNKLYTISQV